MKLETELEKAKKEFNFLNKVLFSLFVAICILIIGLYFKN